MAAVVDRWKKEPERKGRGKQWQVRYRDDCRRDRRKAFDRKIDAERFARAVETQLDRGLYRDPRDAAVTLAEYAERWLSFRVDLRPSTRTLYSGFLANHLRPAFGPIQLGRLRVEHARQYIADAEKADRSDSLTRKTLILATSVLKEAVADGILAENPFGAVRLPKDSPREMRYLDEAQLARLLDEVTPHYRCFVLSAAILGTRFGELVGLHPRNLDLLHGQVRIVEQLAEWDGDLVRAAPKSAASVRTVAIPRFLIGELEEQLHQRSSADFVFTSRSGGPIRKSNFNRRHWQPATERSGLEGLRYHELRHTAVAFAIDAGAHPKAIQGRIGHASIMTTFDVYGHLMEGLDAVLADDMDKKLGQKLSDQRRTSDGTAP